MSARLICTLAFLLCPALSLFADAPSNADLLNRFGAARQATLLIDPTLKPWHLKVNFDLVKAGRVTEQGTMEELWGAPDRWRFIVKSPSYTSTETRNGNKFYRTTGRDSVPFLLRMLREQIEAPMPSPTSFWKEQPREQRTEFSKVPLECILFAPQTLRGEAHLGQVPTFCFDAGQTELRLMLDRGSEEVIRNAPGRFQGKVIAMQVVIAESGAPAVKAHIDQLSTFEPKPDDFVRASDQDPLSIIPEMPGGVMIGHKISGSSPRYPDDAKKMHVTGSVVLRAVIGKDGRVHDITALQSPSKILTDSAIEAVRDWTYQPLLLGGEPVEVETTMTVSFNMS